MAANEKSAELPPRQALSLPTFVPEVTFRSYIDFQLVASHAVFDSNMPLQIELGKSYRRVFINPLVPSATVGAVTGKIGLRPRDH